MGWGSRARARTLRSICVFFKEKWVFGGVLGKIFRAFGARKVKEKCVFRASFEKKIRACGARKVKGKFKNRAKNRGKSAKGGRLRKGWGGGPARERGRSARFAFSLRKSGFLGVFWSKIFARKVKENCLFRASF